MDWINIKSGKLPRNNQKVLISNGKEIIPGWYIKNTFNKKFEFFVGFMFQEEITHWHKWELPRKRANNRE